LRTAVNVNLPSPAQDLEAASFGTPDGRTRWVLRLPGGRPIATPAYADGMLFVGGGYGSHEFYAVDAETGKIIWKIQTGDDGPTAAVVADGMVAFNTESCTLVVVDERGGRVIWQEWLGDPLMSQPAIDKGVLYMAHPAATGRPAKRAEYHPRPATPGGSHRLLAAELSTGRHIWEQEISGDVITAPVISDGTVYFTTFGGNSYALNAADGSVVWVKANAATSAPVVMNGQLYETRKEQAGKDTIEGLARVDAKQGNARDKELIAKSKADYLRAGSGGGVGFSYAMKAPIAFQPALAKGNVYAGTSDGRLICLKTGNKDADGWYAWGGNAQHNKIQ
jgi:Ca-activated chloride channel homolog